LIGEDRKSPAEHQTDAFAVLVLHARAGIHPDIEVLVDRLDERNGAVAMANPPL